MLNLLVSPLTMMISMDFEGCLKPDAGRVCLAFGDCSLLSGRLASF